MLLFKKTDGSKEAGKRVSTRERLIRAAVSLFQQRGYHGVGTAEILALAQVHRGSLYHHFPGGKAELSKAGVDWIASESIEAIRKLRLAGHGPAAIVGILANGMADWLEATGWRESALLPIPAGEADGQLDGSVRAAYEAIITELVQMIEVAGGTPATARHTALNVVSTLDGALNLSRALRDRQPLIAAAELAALILSEHADSQPTHKEKRRKLRRNVKPKTSSGRTRP